MIETVFRTEGVPAAERFGYWRECMTRLLCPMDMNSDYDSTFRAETRLLQLGSLSIWPGGMRRPMRCRRTPKLIRQSDPENYHLSLPMNGSMAISQAGREAIHGANEMYVVDTSQPYECRVFGGPLRGVGLEVPKTLVPLPAHAVGRLLTRRMSAQEGMGAQLAGFLARLADDSGSYKPADEQRLETILIDLFTATLAHHLDADDDLPPETHRRTLPLRIRTFIQHHLHDPGLTPGAIAAAHNISTSYLHSLFRNQDLTVSAWVRHQRLEHARRDLADRAQHTVPVHRIAARWGFTHHAAFTRAFTTAYGLSPRDYRHQAHCDAPSDTRPTTVPALGTAM
ncbi:helix-turn-helix domain-containing protein [Streptomyces sp. NPDC059922]|uniref:AraC-like ligand-binding domain-containing protein n=1 Tax=Streptomyces sp. NPDC059922 TaxID=3347005 RepID=UPI003656B753